MIHTGKTTIQIAAIGAALLAVTALSAGAQIAPEREGTMPPTSGITLMPEEAEYRITIGPAGLEKTLETARDTIWKAVLRKREGQSVTNSLEKIIAEANILVSGISRVNGKETLYIGINEEAYEEEAVYEEKTRALREALRARFPNIPIHIEATELHQSSPSVKASVRQESAEDIFFEDFEGGISAWDVTGDRKHGWRAERLDERRIIDGYTRDNKVAQSENCDIPCILTIGAPIDLTEYESAYLSLDRFVDNSLDDGEYLKVEIGNNGRYRQIFKWTPEKDDDDNEWNHETYDLSAYMNSDRFMIRISSKQSSFAEETAVDNIRITAREPESAAVKTCMNGPNRSFPLLGGDRVITLGAEDDGMSACSTVTLGGVETDTGKEGFIITDHAVQLDDDPENALIFAGHTLSRRGSTYAVSGPIGKVDRRPFKWNYVIDDDGDMYLFENDDTERGDTTIMADATFVEYPSTTRCEDEWLNQCFRREYEQRVRARRIRGDNTTYVVTGSTGSYLGMRVRSMGAATRQERAGEVASKRMLFSPDLPKGSHYVYYFTESPERVHGDSGSPVYTVPVSGNEVKIVGIYIGTVGHLGEEIGVFNAWEDVEKALRLKSL